MDINQIKCPVHGLDFRLYCTRCQECSDMIQDILEEQLSIDYEDKGVPSLNDTIGGADHD